MLIRDDFAIQACTYGANKILLQLFQSYDLLFVEDLKVIRRAKVPDGFTLGKCLLLPGFDEENFPFMLDYGTISDNYSCRKVSNSYDLLNVKTGQRDLLLQGSAQND